LFSAEGIVVEAAALFVAKAEVCGAPFVALVGYSEKHINKVGKFGDGMEPDNGLPGGGGTDAVKNVCYGFGRSGCRYELVTDQEGVEASGFGGIEGVTVEMGFCRRQVGKAVGNTRKETELADGLKDVGVGIGYESDDPVELGVLVGRQVEVEVVGCPLAANVSDLGGGTLDLAIDEFKKKIELGGCETQLDEFGGDGFGGTGLEVVEKLGEGKGT
jgi:hypothetical protein